MKFPLIKNNKPYWKPAIKNGKCILCGEKPKHGVFIALMGGTLEGNKNSASISSNLIGFLSLNLHDHNSDKLGYLNIADNTSNGQFEFYFCSSKCLRKFFNKIVDEFEKTL